MKGMEIEKPTEWMRSLSFTQRSWQTSKWTISSSITQMTIAAEIAEEFGVSRQAVYDNIKRTEKILEDYEMKLHMYSDYIVRSQIFDQILERYPKILFYKSRLKFYQALTIGRIMGALSHLSRNTLKLLVLQGSISHLDYRLSRPMNTRYVNRF